MNINTPKIKGVGTILVLSLNRAVACPSYRIRQKPHTEYADKPDLGRIMSNDVGAIVTVPIAFKLATFDSEDGFQ